MAHELKFMIITKNSKIAQVAAQNKVRIMIDIERNGKQARQGHKDTFISDHQFEDLSALKEEFPEAEFILRINPLYKNTCIEVEEGISRGADHIMLPMFRKAEEVQRTADFIRGRIPLIPLVETGSALVHLDKICDVSGVQEIHLGLNDLSIDMQLDFCFEPLFGGLVDLFCTKARIKNKIYGFGGISTIGSGLLPAEDILKEHARLGSQRIILSRSFIKNVEAKCASEISFDSVFTQELLNITDCYAKGV